MTGHHSTVQETDLKRLFPKTIRAALLAKLAPDEQVVFKQALQGKRMIGDERKERWRKLLSDGTDK